MSLGWKSFIIIDSEILLQENIETSCYENLINARMKTTVSSIILGETVELQAGL